MDNMVNLTLAELSGLSNRVLTANGMAADHAQAIAEVIVAGQRDECQSHGIYRLIVCVNTLRNGKVVRDAKPELIDVSPALVRVDAKFGYSQLAFQMGSKVLVQKARQVGIAALAINHCFHFSALWPEVEYLAGEGLAALAQTQSPLRGLDQGAFPTCLTSRQAQSRAGTLSSTGGPARQSLWTGL